MEYTRYYSTIILWASPFALSGIIRNYDGEFPYKIARTLFNLNNISYVGRMIIRPSIHAYTHAYTHRCTHTRIYAYNTYIYSCIHMYTLKYSNIYLHILA